MIRDHNRHAGPELAPLHAGQRVRILNKETHQWCPGEIITRCAAPRSYIVQTPNGTRMRRTRYHLRELVRQPTHTPTLPVHPAVKRSVTFRDDDNTLDWLMSAPVTTAGDTATVSTPPSEPMVRRLGRVIRKPSRFDE